LLSPALKKSKTFLIKKMKKKALIVGVYGQDGSYLAELLIKKKYFVYGIVNKVKKKISNTNRNLKIINISINNYAQVSNLIRKIKPHEIYHLGSKSFVNYDFDSEFFNLNPSINGTNFLLAAIKEFSPKSKFYFAASSEIFGNPKKSPQNENTQFNPRSAYGISKLAGYHLTKNYREAHGLFACSGILYNHESPRRGDFFVTKKIAKAVARIKKGLDKKIYLGNINAKRDWGYSKDYVKYMWKSLQLKKPQDFVLGTGKLHSVKDFLKIAFKRVGLNYQKYLVIDKKYYRNENKINLVADNSVAKKKLKFKPSKSFKEMVHEMVDFELEKLNNN
jgi:GDPmannose 4,6-dehydratase